jgi:hypothetical protein
MRSSQRRSLETTLRRFGLIVRSTTFILFGLAAGCGREGPYSGSLYPVKGQVLLADGKPLTGGTVQFIPKAGRRQEKSSQTARSH